MKPPKAAPRPPNGMAANRNRYYLRSKHELPADGALASKDATLQQSYRETTDVFLKW